MEGKSKSVVAIKAWKTRKQAGVKKKKPDIKESAPAKVTAAQPKGTPEENPSAIYHSNSNEAYRQGVDDTALSTKRGGYKKASAREGSSDLKAFPEVQTWLKTVSIGTHSLYLAALKKFCEFSGKDLHQLILQRDSEIKSDKPNSRTRIRDLVLDFRIYLEKEGFTPKTINSMDGGVRSFFTAVLGKAAMVNVKNYRNREVSTKKQLVPTLEELKTMLDVSNLEEKFRILFVAQTGMRISDALSLKVGDVARELELGKVPLAIEYLPEKERETSGKRITFLASEGVELLKRYLEWRRELAEKISSDSPLFASRT